jgi:DNA-binding MarR family transcriptional regulator
MTLSQQNRLSSLQLAILRSLSADLRRRPRTTTGVPYSDLLHATNADKMSITTSLRQLMRKGLVLLTVPRGSWTRCVTLTEQGQAYAKTLPSIESRRDPKAEVYEIADLTRHEKRWQAAELRQDRRRDKQQKRDSRRTRRRGE